MLAGATKSFIDMVLVGEMVENALKTGKLEGGESSAVKKNPKKKEGDVNTAGYEGYQQYPQQQYRPNQSQYRQYQPQYRPY